MIDEKKLMEILKEWADSAPPFESDIVTDVIGIVEEQPKVGEWIPVSEGLPKENDSYLGNESNKSMFYREFKIY